MSFLALFVEETFATAEILDASVGKTPSVVARKSWYLPKESLKNGLHSFVNSRKIEKVFVVDRFTKKILKFRLGGSVALITLPGLAKYHELTMQGTFGDQRFHPEQKPALSSEDLRFEILDPAKAMTEIEPKLKMMGCKRILAHHPELSENSEIKKSFEALGYEIFCIPFRSSLNDLRKSLLSLSVQGTFEDIENEITSALGKTTEILWFGAKGFQKNEVADRYSFLSSWPANSVEQLFMGWDQCYLLKPQQPAIILGTGLGSVFEFESSNYQWTQNQSLDPGPLSFGRGQKIVALDFFVEEFTQQGYLTELVNKEKFESKWNMQWKVCQKFHPKLTADGLREEWLEQLVIEAYNSGANESLQLTGPASHLLAGLLKRTRSALLKKLKVASDFQMNEWVLQ